MADLIDIAEFAERLRAEIKKRNWTQAEFARRIAIETGAEPPSPPTVNKWLKGKAYPRNFIQSIGRVLGLSSDELVRPAVVKQPDVGVAIKALRDAMPGIEESKLAEISAVLRRNKSPYSDLDLPTDSTKDSSVRARHATTKRARQRKPA